MNLIRIVFHDLFNKYYFVSTRLDLYNCVKLCYVTSFPANVKHTARKHDPLDKYERLEYKAYKQLNAQSTKYQLTWYSAQLTHEYLLVAQSAVDTCETEPLPSKWKTNSKVNMKMTVFKELRKKVSVKIFCSITYILICIYLNYTNCWQCVLVGKLRRSFLLLINYFCCSWFVRCAHAPYHVQYDNYWMSDNYWISDDNQMLQNLITRLL